MSSGDIGENIRQRSQWLRIFFMLAYTVALYVTAVVLLVLVLAQALFALLTGRDNLNLRRLGANLTAYVSQILAFLTYNSETRPYPLAPFPWLDDEDVAEMNARHEGKQERRAPQALLAAPRREDADSEGRDSDADDADRGRDST